MNCTLCPHQCNIDRATFHGRCHSGSAVSVAHVGTHMWEEPIISGNSGSGTIFFGGCNLGCRFCQNHDISHANAGVQLSSRQLADVMLAVGNSGVHNINLVSPMHHVAGIVDALELVKHKLTVPVVYNTNSYELPSTIDMLDGLVDVYLPDLKFYSNSLSMQLCGVDDYFAVASRAISVMRSQQPQDIIVDGIMTSGMIVRHLTLPFCRRDSLEVLEHIAHLDKHMYVSIMSQYTPVVFDQEYNFLNKTVSARQYDSLLQYAVILGLDNVFSQQLDSADNSYVPQWDSNSVYRYMGEKK